MTEDQFKQAQLDGQVESVTPQLPEQQKPTLTIDDVKRQLDSYVATLETLRQGTVCAKIYKDSAQTLTAHSIPYDVITFNKQAFTKGVTVDLTNYQLKASTSGFYLIQGQLTIVTATSGNAYVPTLLVNDTVVNYAPMTGSGNDLTVRVSDIRYLNAGDAVKLACYGDRPLRSSVTTFPDAETFLYIIKL